MTEVAIQRIVVLPPWRSSLDNLTYASLFLCRFSDAGITGLSTRRDGRRPKSAKARNRGEGYGLGGAARSAMGIWPSAGHS